MFTKLLTPSAQPGPSPAARFNDPVADKTSWAPLKPGGANFKTNVLTEVHPGRLEFRVSKGMIAFSGVFSTVGLVVLGIKFSKFGTGWQKDDWMLIGFGALFGLVGLGMMFFGSTPRVFDRQLGYYAKSRKKPANMADLTDLKKHIRLNHIHAIQLVSEFVTSSKSRYYSYELNLVLDDGSRINVIDHGNLEAIRSDAQKLATFLGKPVWDAT